MDKNPNATFVYVCSDLMSRIIKNCRGEQKKGRKRKHDLRCKLGFTLHDVTMSKEESLTIKIIKNFRTKKYYHNTLF